MAKHFKDHFGNATKAFDRINKYTKDRPKRLEEYSLAEQIKIMEAEEAEAKEKAKKDAEAKRKAEENAEPKYSSAFIQSKENAEIEALKPKKEKKLRKKDRKSMGQIQAEQEVKEKLADSEDIKE